METYLIGEIGQNHNGSVDIARLIVDSAAREVEEKLFHLKLRGMNAVKMTKRDLQHELSESQMKMIYNGPNSFGLTYGAHRDFLELDYEQHLAVFKHAKSLGLDFIETLCAPGCIKILDYFTPDHLKVASRDLTNLPLLETLAETGISIILSTGMAGNAELDNALDVITRYHNRITILHCVSEYPTQPHNVNLRSITHLQKRYPKYRIGYSDHTIGISVPVAAVAMGASVIEKHITLDRRMKGTDQTGSLGPDGLNRMVRDIRLLELEMGEEGIFIASDVKLAQKKLERSIASRRLIRKGERITEADIFLLSPGDGFKWQERNHIVGRIAVSDIPANELIYPKNIKNEE